MWLIFNYNYAKIQHFFAKCNILCKKNRIIVDFLKFFPQICTIPKIRKHKGERRDMEEYKKNSSLENEKEIVFSQAIKAGKRIYYIDVKKNRKDEMYLSITESKKIVSGEDAQISFEKHKIFLYREDFEKFVNGLNEAVQFIVDAQGPCVSRAGFRDAATSVQESDETAAEEPIKIDIDF